MTIHVYSMIKKLKWKLQMIHDEYSSKNEK